MIWNYIGHDPDKFRHHGPWRRSSSRPLATMESGLSVTPTINSGDMAAIMMVAIQALEKRTAELKNKKAGIRELREEIAQLNRLRTETAELTCKQAHFERIAGRLEALEVKFKFPLQWHVVSGENLAEAKP
jgi:ABC-type transport system involved in cytochrome bd biosynthesis fused ATPase/permease subunit